MDDGTCRTLKSQYQQTSTANFVRHTGGYAATGVIEYEDEIQEYLPQGMDLR